MSTARLGGDYALRVYHAVVGKVLGVYLGRPVEGWPYERVRERFGQIAAFPALELGEPLIVADDDISASFMFPRALEDGRDLSPRSVADAWLNYIIESRSVLWWGGLGRSTEHTALVNLKRGLLPPESGSAATNGTTLAEQIGALIFDDMFALLYPGDPDGAAEATRVAGSVSHDGAALEAATYLAAVRATLFDGATLASALRSATSVVRDDRVTTVVERTLEWASEHPSWRDVRDLVDRDFGYAVLPGPCHALSNLGIVVMALAMGDDVLACAGIAASAGFDSDSNAGVVGSTAALAMGEDGLASSSALRAQAADRMLVVTADGGECVTDAAREALRLIALGQRRDLEGARFTFPWEGAYQGFSACPVIGPHDTTLVAQRGLTFDVGPEARAVSTPTFLEEVSATGFSTLASPTLYPGQLVDLRLSADAQANVTLYAVLAAGGATSVVESAPVAVRPGVPAAVSWRVPTVDNAVIRRIGVSAASEGDRAAVTITSLDWADAPDGFRVQGRLQADIWDLDPLPLRAWISEASNFEADYDLAVAIANTNGRGIATTGGRDWADYRVSATSRPSLNSEFGLIGRARGLRRYYALRVAPGVAQILRVDDGEESVLASAPVTYDIDRLVLLSLAFDGTQISASVGDHPPLIASDDRFPSGGAGLLVADGAQAVDNFLIQATQLKGNQS